MVLKLNELSQGRERLHDVKLESLGDSITIRELSRSEMSAFHENKAHFNGEDMSHEGLVKFLCLTLTDSEQTVMTPEMAESFLSKNAKTVVAEIVKSAISIHTGAESGES